MKTTIRYFQPVLAVVLRYKENYYRENNVAKIPVYSMEIIFG
jgi:hypothetical protein